MFVHRSNHTDALVDVLAGLMTQPPANPLAAECIVVQGRGMERWLAMQLAQRLGVWANPDFPFPRTLIERAITAVLGTAGAPSPCFAPEMMLWSVASLLPQHLDEAGFAPIRTYLADDARGIRRIQLAQRIADTFDQYVVYRPHMVLAWEGGAETHWQARLWRALVNRHGSYHIAARAGAFIEAIERSDARLNGFPARVSLFGISTLPPLYLEMLAALSRHIEIHLFWLSPSPEYWAELRSHRAVLRLLAKNGTGRIDAESWHFEDSNPLLTSLARVGRDFQQMLETTVAYQEDRANLYVEPDPANALVTLQADIFFLRHRAPGRSEAPPLPLHARDDSIRVHACHGPMREVEVLHDQLLALLDSDSTLEPRDVIVMSPAIDAYAPFIDAVFGGAGDHHPHIPYRIADRAVRATEDAIDAFLILIRTLRGRMTASEVLDLLALDPIRQFFGFAAADLDLVRTWVKESGVRWGIDAAHRAEVQQPPLAEHTWRFGLDRLLLGYAMSGAGRRLFGGVLPYDDIEGTTAELLGRLVQFCEALFAARASMQAPRPMEAWREDLGRLLRTMLADTNEWAHQHRHILVVLAELSERARRGQFEDPVDLDAVHMQLVTALERAAPGRGFLTGGVTFCAFLPMRSIPFRVVCLLGMNEDAFPRLRRPLGFDLMAQKPKLGDRSSRDDDRYLFLEALLSARERLIVTYVGQSIRDNSAIPPSVVISELLDSIDESFVLAPEDLDGQAERSAAPKPSALLTVRHPLQPFSPRYFGADTNTALFSYAHNYYAAAQALTGVRGSPLPFLSAPLSPLTLSRQVTVDELARFFENPTRVFLQNRLALYLGDDSESLDDREPLDLRPLERWKIGTGLLERAFEGQHLAAALPFVRASGSLPPGALGSCVFEDLRREAATIAGAAAELLSDQPLDPLIVDAKVDDTRITGALRHLWPQGQVHYQFSKLGGRSELRLWIYHLVLNWQRQPGYPDQSFLVGRTDKKGRPARVQFLPVENAGSVLRSLLELYWFGQAAPLLLFAQASRTYAEHVHHSQAEAVEKARQAFRGNDFRSGDLSNPYVSQVFAGTNPLDPAFRFGANVTVPSTRQQPVPLPAAFTAVAAAVFGPLLAHRQVMR